MGKGWNEPEQSTAFFGVTVSQPATQPLGYGIGGCQSPGYSLSGVSKIPPGAIIANRYKVAQEIGHGAISSVMSAWDLMFQRWVAVKISMQGNASISLDEAGIQSRCQHPNVMQLYDAGYDSLMGVPFIVMPLYPGSDLAMSISRYGTLYFKPAILCADQICSALTYLWQQRQIVHGDIKPSNIWITENGAALLMDFNLTGLLMQSGSDSAGTPGYIAPEVFQGRRDQRSDVFSLGCVIYQCLGGVPPYKDNDAAVSGRHIPLRNLRTDIWPDLEKVIHTAIHPNPERRYQTAKEFQTALRRPGIKNGTGWGTATAKGINAVLGIIFSGMSALYKAAIKKLSALFVGLFKRPKETLVEIILLYVFYRLACPLVIACYAANKERVILSLSAILIAMVFVATVSAKINPHANGRKRRK